MSGSRFAGKVALVVGGTSGIGRQTAIEFAAEGARVVVAGRRDDRGEQVVSDIRALNGDAVFLHADVAQPRSVAALIDTVIRDYGRLDVSFNNAGVGGENFKRTGEHTEQNWDWVVNTNLKGTWLCMRCELEAMARTGRGAIVNTASIYGMAGSEFGIAPYIASKHGVLGLTRAAAVEYARQGIRVNAVCPGITLSEMTAPAIEQNPAEFAAHIDANVPMGRVADPIEIARAVLWLSSEEASFVTGAALTVDGGWLAK